MRLDSKSCSIAAFAVMLLGCVKNPATGVADSGEPLRVQYSSGTGTYTSNDVVSTSVHRDSAGNEVGTTEEYAPVEHSFQWNDWKYYQGRDELDEHDFYRIAGDQKAADEVAALRDKAARKMKLGGAAAAAGYAAAIVLTAVGVATDSRAITTLGYVGGSTVGSVGGLVWYWGTNEMKRKHHLPTSRANRNADIIEDCNDKNGCERWRGGRARHARSP